MKVLSTTLREYLDPTQQIGKAVRHSFCPFCNDTVGRKGFIVTRTERGYVMFCHRCHAKRFVRSKTPGVTDCLRISKEAVRKNSTWTLRKHVKKQVEPLETKDCDVQFVSLPFDTTRELPTRARLWLSKYNISQQEIDAYNFLWSNSYSRLILPVYKAGKLVYWQGRYFGEDTTQPKYINTRNKRTEVWFDTGGVDGYSTIVLCEDILSAIAISRVPGYRAVALLGCYLSDEMLVRLQSEGRQVCLWLDLDKRATSYRYSKRLKEFGLNAKSVVTPKDPKEYKPEQIREFLEGKQQSNSDTSSTEATIDGEIASSSEISTDLVTSDASA